MDDLPEFECAECDLVFSIIWKNDGSGGWDGNYCPRCGSDATEELIY